MVSFSNLVADQATVNIDIKGETLRVTYKPSNLSPAFFQKLGEELEDDDPQAFSKLFCEVVSSWDLEGPLGDVPAGQPVPLDPAHVSWVPGAILRFIIEQIGEDSTPKSRKKR